MVSGLFLNSCILIAFFSVFNIIVKKKDINFDTSIGAKLFMGSATGLLGILLMLYSFAVTPKNILDFRTVSVMIAAIYGGVLPALLASIIIVLFRVFYFGISSAAMIAAAVLLIRALGFSIISRLNIKRKVKWIDCVVYSFAISVISSIIPSNPMTFRLNNFIIYNFGLIILCFFTYHYIEYILENTRMYRKLREESTLDFLTGLNNVRQFEKVFNMVAARAVNKGEYLSLLFIDIDFFKHINDAHGHGAGDLILRQVAEILRNTCRDYDIVSRNGGEEFTVILLDCPSLHAMEIADRIRKRVEENEFYISEKLPISITVSIGVSTYPSITTDMDKLLEDADNALYRAKSGGRNRIVLYDDKITKLKD